MLDPLQNILHCMDMIRNSRESSHLPEEDKLYCMVGEMDHACEIQRQLEEVRMHQKGNTVAWRATIHA